MKWCPSLPRYKILWMSQDTYLLIACCCEAFCRLCLQTQGSTLWFASLIHHVFRSLMLSNNYNSLMHSRRLLAMLLCLSFLCLMPIALLPPLVARLLNAQACTFLAAWNMA